MDWQQLVNLGAAGAVIGVVKLFLNALSEWGKSRDVERQAFLAEIKAERDAREVSDAENRQLIKEFSDTMRVVAAKCPGPTEGSAVANNGHTVGPNYRR